MPVRHFTVLRDAGRRSSACLALLGLPVERLRRCGSQRTSRAVDNSTPVDKGMLASPL